MQYRLFVLLSFAGAVLAGTLVAAAPQPIVSSHQAGIVVQFGDGHVATACVAFAGPSISGFDLLQQSGLQVVAQTDSGNALVCKIDQQGCSFPNQACLCQCAGGTACRYWAYWHLNGGHWQFSTLGASSTQVQPGGVDGWAWGGGSVASGSQPPLLSFDQICLVPVATTVPPTKSLPSATTVRTKQPPTAVPTRPIVLPTANTLPPSLLPTRPLILPTANTLPPPPTQNPSPTTNATAAPATTTNAPTPTTTASMPHIASSVITPSSTPRSEPSSATRLTLATPTPLLAGGAIQQPSPAVPSSGWISYLFFGVLLIGLLVAIGIVRRRQP